MSSEPSLVRLAPLEEPSGLDQRLGNALFGRAQMRPPLGQSGSAQVCVDCLLLIYIKIYDIKVVAFYVKL